MYIYKTDMRNVRNFNVRKRHLNMQGKNIMRGQSIKVHKEKPEEIKGYGVLDGNLGLGTWVGNLFPGFRGCFRNHQAMGR